MPKLNNLTELAEFLKKMKNDHPRRKVGFDMQYAYDNRQMTDHPCGTAMCIGGWVQNFNKETRFMSVTDAVLTICPRGTDWDAVENLCFPGGTRHSGWLATPQQAARAVEILRDTGECDWDRAMEEVPA